MCLDISHPWTLYGPRQAHLTMHEVVICLHTNEKAFRTLVRDGKFPPGIQETPKSTAYWCALDIAAYLWMRGRGARAGVEIKDDGGESEDS